MSRVRLAAAPEARPALEAWLAAHGTLAGAGAADPRAEVLRGRGRVYVVPAPEGPWPAGTQWVVRHYRRGGAVAAVLGDRYVRLGKPRPLREYDVLRRLDADGVAVVRPVGAAVYGAGPLYRGDLVTELVPGARDLAAVLFGARQLDEVRGDEGGTSPGTPQAVEAMVAAGRLVRELHESGVVHPDLNLKNILIAEGSDGRQRAIAVDLDRARIRKGGVSGGARRRMLARFRRSLRKWEARAGMASPAAWLEAFERGYGRSR